MIKKRILCIALVGVLSFLLCACGDTDASAFEYEEKGDGTISIIGLLDESLEVMVIPEQISGKPVTEIGDRIFYGCNKLTTINTPKGSYAKY